MDDQVGAPYTDGLRPVRFAASHDSPDGVAIIHSNQQAQKQARTADDDKRYDSRSAERQRRRLLLMLPPLLAEVPFISDSERRRVAADARNWR